jgi:hypothetical protein
MGSILNRRYLAIAVVVGWAISSLLYLVEFVDGRDAIDIALVATIAWLVVRDRVPDYITAEDLKNFKSDLLQFREESEKYLKNLGEQEKV